MHTIEQWSPATIAPHQDVIQRIYAAAFQTTAVQTQQFRKNLAQHRQRRDFRFITACDSQTGEPHGFAYGYAGEPDQWYHDLLTNTLEPRLVEQWVRGAYEVVELAVLPGYQGQGLGKRLHDALLAELPYRTAILSTQADNQVALGLYQGRGWQIFQPRYLFPNTPIPFSLLGLHLPYTPPADL